MDTNIYRLRQKLLLPFGLTIIALAGISLIAELLPEVEAKPIVITTLILTIIVVTVWIIRR